MYSLRSKLSYEQFAQFLHNIKELNAGRQNRDETLRRVRDIFGYQHQDLFGAWTRPIHPSVASSTYGYDLILFILPIETQPSSTLIHTFTRAGVFEQLLNKAASSFGAWGDKHITYYGWFVHLGRGSWLLSTSRVSRCLICFPAQRYGHLDMTWVMMSKEMRGSTFHSPPFLICPAAGLTNNFLSWSTPLTCLPKSFTFDIPCSHVCLSKVVQFSGSVWPRSSAPGSGSQIEPGWTGPSPELDGGMVHTVCTILIVSFFMRAIYYVSCKS